MKILFVVGNVYPNDNANSNIVWSLVESMHSQGHQVDVLGKKELGAVSIKRPELYYYEIRELNNLNSEYSLLKNNLGKLLYLLKHPKERLFRKKMNMSTCYVEEQYKKICRKQIEILCERNQYEAVISVSMPIFTSVALAEAQIEAKKIEYRLDPYAFNQLERIIDFETKISIEEKILCNVNHAFFPIPDYFDMSHCDNLEKYLHKMSPLEFPNIVEHKIRETKLSKSIKENGLSFAFVGYLYEDIRNPVSVLDFFVRLRRDLNFKLYLIGGGCEELLKKYQNILEDSLVIVKRVSADESYAVINRADYLINIGNTVRNMVPSKIFDYFSSGRPIINFVKSMECPSLPYTNLYKNCISVQEDKWEEKYAELLEFCSARHDKLKIEEIKSIFEKNTPQSVANRIISELGD